LTDVLGVSRGLKIRRVIPQIIPIVQSESVTPKTPCVVIGMAVAHEPAVGVTEPVIDLQIEGVTVVYALRVIKNGVCSGGARKVWLEHGAAE
jgi:hypothetical protein